MKKMQNYGLLFAVSLVIVTTSIFCWSQIALGDEPIYCFDPGCFLYGNDCIGHCDYGDIKACELAGGTFLCCEYETGGWWCDCEDTK